MASTKRNAFHSKEMVSTIEKWPPLTRMTYTKIPFPLKLTVSTKRIGSAKKEWPPVKGKISTEKIGLY